jgi:hypothetical protein
LHLRDWRSEGGARSACTATVSSLRPRPTSGWRKQVSG